MEVRKKLDVEQVKTAGQDNSFLKKPPLFYCHLWIHTVVCSSAGSNACRVYNGGCSSLCLAIPGGRQCACAEDQILDPADNTSCKGEVKHMRLYCTCKWVPEVEGGLWQHTRFYFRFAFSTNQICFPSAAKFGNSKLYFASFSHSFYSSFPVLLFPQPTRLTCPLLSASLGSLPARTTAASRTAGSATGTMTVWTTATRLLNCAVSYYRHIHTRTRARAHTHAVRWPPAVWIWLSGDARLK